MIRLRVDEAAAIPLAVESASPVSMTVKEEFIDRGGASIQSNKTATPGAAAVVVTPDPGYDALAKVTVEAVPQGALSPIDIDFDDSTGAFTAEARVGTSGYIPDTAQVGGGFQLDTQAAATITPSTVQQQAVAAHKYTKGAVVVAPIPSEYIVPSGTKNIEANGNNQDVKAYEKVNVNVPNSYSASDEGKVVSNGALVSQSSATYTENGTYDTTTKNEVVVNVPGIIPSGKYTASSNGTDIDISQYALLDVAVSGGSSVASGTYTPASDERNPTIDPNVDSDMLLFYVAPDGGNPLGNNKRVAYGGLWSKLTDKRIFYMESNAPGGSWTAISVDLSQTQPSGTAYNLNTNYLISGITYQWYAWKIS